MWVLVLQGFFSILFFKDERKHGACLHVWKRWCECPEKV